MQLPLSMHAPCLVPCISWACGVQGYPAHGNPYHGHLRPGDTKPASCAYVWLMCPLQKLGMGAATIETNKMRDEQAKSLAIDKDAAKVGKDLQCAC